MEEYHGRERRCGNKELVKFVERLAVLESKLDAANNSLTVAREAMEKRLDGMNEFRETLRDQAAKFITRGEVNIRFEGNDKSRKDNLALLFSLLGILIAVTSLFLKFYK